MQWLRAVNCVCVLSDGCLCFRGTWFMTNVDHVLYDWLGMKSEDERDDGDVFYEEDVFSWRDTNVGNQLVWMYTKVSSLWGRQQHEQRKMTSFTARL